MFAGGFVAYPECRVCVFEIEQCNSIMLRRHHIAQQIISEVKELHRTMRISSAFRKKTVCCLCACVCVCACV